LESGHDDLVVHTRTHTPAPPTHTSTHGHTNVWQGPTHPHCWRRAWSLPVLLQLLQLLVHTQATSHRGSVQPRLTVRTQIASGVQAATQPHTLTPRRFTHKHTLTPRRFGSRTRRRHSSRGSRCGLHAHRARLAHRLPLAGSAPPLGGLHLAAVAHDDPLGCGGGLGGRLRRSALASALPLPGSAGAKHKSTTHRQRAQRSCNSPDTDTVGHVEK
jgi:hypothetical protein